MMPALLTRAGEALYGPSWQAPLADALHVSGRTIRYWLAGRPIPDGVWLDLAELAEEQAWHVLPALAADLRNWRETR